MKRYEKHEVTMQDFVTYQEDIADTFDNDEDHAILGFCSTCGRDVYAMESALEEILYEAMEHDFPSSVLERAAKALGIPVVYDEAANGGLDE
jgi:hypothetical protein